MIVSERREEEKGERQMMKIDRWRDRQMKSDSEEKGASRKHGWLAP